MLTLEDVVYRSGDFALEADIALDPPGLVAIIGPSGSGKSTLLSLIAGFVLPDRGRVLWQGRDLGERLPGDRPVATLFQDNNLFPHLDVLTNVTLGLVPRGTPTDFDLAKARAALDRVGLAGFETRKPGALSGGQQSRAALARVLLTDRPVVLLDEAFSALGPRLRQDMLALTVELLPDALILMVTHDPADAQEWAARTVFIESGKVYPPRDTSALFADPPEALRQYLS